MQKIITFGFLLATVLAAQSPKHEVRGVWISTASGDWPLSTNREEQQRSLAEMFDRLERLNVNTVFFQVRPRGNTYYRSTIEPWANQLTGTLGNDPEWDPLQFALDEAHRRGMELHAWINIGKVWGLDTPPVHPKHLFRTHREWLKQVEGEWWIDLGIPEARMYTEEVVIEIVRQYDVDGVHFDFIRYPGESFDDWSSFQQWSGGIERNEWRRNNITDFVRSCYQAIQSIAPRVKVGSAPVGIYRPLNGAQSSFNGYDGVFQDSRRWLREGIHDYLAPQLYWSIGEQQNPYDPDFSALCFDWTRELYDRHLYTGIGIYRDNVREETAAQVLVARSNGAQGEVFFRYEHVASVEDRIASVYRSKALIPPMRWKDSIPPLPPGNITVTKNGAETAVIRWNRPPAALDAEVPFRYVVYRSAIQPVDVRRGENIAAIVSAAETSYVDAAVNGRNYFYTVTSLDRSWNESGADATVDDVALLFRRYARPDDAVIVSQHYPEPFGSTSYFSLLLMKPERVVMSVRAAGALRDTVVVNDQKQAGFHIIGVNASRLPAGEVECTIRVGRQVFRRILTKK